MSQENGFKLRNFISLLITFSGLLMIVSGVVAYVMPEGRIAYWTDWRYLSLAKEQWGTIHTVLGFVFFLSTLFHVFYNWSALMTYLKDRVKKTFCMRKELLAAIIVTVLCTHGSIAGVPPFTSIMDLGKMAKKTWYAGQDVHPPFPHAEIMTLKQLTSKLNLNLDGSLAYLHEQGFTEADGKSTLKDLVERNELSPGQVFDAMMMDDRVYQ